VQPTLEDVICDPSAGTCGFLTVAGEYVREHYEKALYDDAAMLHFQRDMFMGMEFEPTMIRIGAMNLILHGIENPQLRDVDALSEANTDFSEKASLILANPPFKGSLDREAVDGKILSVVDSKKTELLFLALILKGLKLGGRAAVIVPDGVLFGSSKAHLQIRKELIDHQKLQGIVSMPSGLFKPYAGVSTAVLLFTKTNSGGTDHVWFYDCDADGWSLDDKRNPLLDEAKPGPVPTAKLTAEEHAKNNLPDILARWQSLKSGTGGPPVRGNENAPNAHGRAAHATLRQDLAIVLHGEVAAMNVDNFVVRPKRRLVETYAKPVAWNHLSQEARAELSHEVAGLPSERDPESEEAKRFDLLMLNLQLAQMRAEPAFERLMKQVKTIAGLLEEKSAIPMVKERMALILDLQTDEWWQDVTIPLLENVRRRLRDLVKLIDKQQRTPLYPDFEDEIGEGTEITLPGVVSGNGDFEKFRAKARAFLLEHQDHVAVRKLRLNQALNPNDLAELERMLVMNGIGKQDDIAKAKETAHGLGLFVRTLIGLDREAAKGALATFLNGKNWTANQIEFVNLIINYLTEHGVMEAALLYESPFTDLTPKGPDGLFTSKQVDELMAVLERVRGTAVAA